MRQKTSAGFCDTLAEPSPTDRQAAGLLSRKVTGEVRVAALGITESEGHLGIWTLTRRSTTRVGRGGVARLAGLI